jgi:hypothetical protein
MRTASSVALSVLGLVAASAAQNQPPVASATADRTIVKPGERVWFDASRSYDPEGGPLTYVWSLLHQCLDPVVAPCHVFAEPGVFTVGLRVNDDQGASDFDFIEITVDAASGACCAGTVCVVSAQAGCAGVFQGEGSVCGAPDNPTTCCPANFNQSGGVSVQDLFDFLAAYFGNDARADFNQSGATGVQDIFDFLAAFFAGQPLADVNGVSGHSVQDIFDFLAAYFAGCT